MPLWEEADTRRAAEGIPVELGISSSRMEDIGDFLSFDSS